MQKKSNLNVKEAKWRVSVFISSKGEANNLADVLGRCGYAPRVDLVPDKNLEALQDFAEARKEWKQ
jgi:hypothetical protein